MPSPQKYSYGKRPLWQWVLIYLIVGGLVYFAVYYFFLKPRYSSNSYGQPQGNHQNGVNYP